MNEAEPFVNTLRREYLDGADRNNAADVVERPGWIADQNENAPHLAQGYRSPAEHPRLVQTRHTELCLMKQESKHSGRICPPLDTS